MYVDRHTVCQLTYCMSIEIHQCMYADRHTVCWLTYSISIDIHGVYVDWHTVCRSTYDMSIEILYVDRLLCLTDMRTTKAQISLPVHPRSLISAFVFCCLDSIIPVLAYYKISRLYLASIAEQACLSLTWSKTPKTGFLMTWLNRFTGKFLIIF